MLRDPRREPIARVADLFGRKFPTLAPGATMSISFFRIAPTEIQFIDNTQARWLAPGMFGAEFHRERSYAVFGGLPTRTAETISASLQSVTPGRLVVARRGNLPTSSSSSSAANPITRADGE